MPIGASCRLFGKIVLGVKGEVFEHELERRTKSSRAPATDADLSAEALKDLVAGFKDIVRQETGEDFPTDPAEAAGTGDYGRLLVLERQARDRLSQLQPDLRMTSARRSTSRPWSSATWATTRGPAWPSPGIPPPARSACTASTCSTHRARTWWPVSAPRRRSPPLSATCPQVYEEFAEIGERLERHYKDVQDLEFTIENGQAVHAADPLGQAHRRCGGEDRRGYGA